MDYILSIVIPAKAGIQVVIAGRNFFTHPWNEYKKKSLKHRVFWSIKKEKILGLFIFSLTISKSLSMFVQLVEKLTKALIFKCNPQFAQHKINE